jgi:osmotically-inducible protein OsmY
MTQNSELYAKIMEKLEFEPALDSSEIGISVLEHEIVVLTGKVKSYTEKYLAEEAVKKIEDVRGVVNEVEVDLALSYKRSDTEIAQNVINALRWAMFIPDERIKVTVEKGHVALSGSVDYYFQKERAEKAIRDIVGINSILNNINVNPTISPAEVKKRIIKEFERNALIDANKIQVEIHGSEVTLKEKVRNFTEKEEALKVAWSIPGVTKVNDLLTVGR